MPFGPAIAVGRPDVAKSPAERLHIATYQADTALESLDSAEAALKRLLPLESGITKQDLEKLLSLLNQAARDINDSLISHEAGEPQNESAGDPQRAKTRQLATVLSSQKVSAARSIVEDMLQSSPPKTEQTALEEAATELTTAIDSLDEAAKQLDANGAHN